VERVKESGKFYSSAGQNSWQSVHLLKILSLHKQFFNSTVTEGKKLKERKRRKIQLPGYYGENLHFIRFCLQILSELKIKIENFPLFLTEVQHLLTSLVSHLPIIHHSPTTFPFFHTFLSILLFFVSSL